MNEGGGGNPKFNRRGRPGEMRRLEKRRVEEKRRN